MRSTPNRCDGYFDYTGIEEIVHHNKVIVLVTSHAIRNQSIRPRSNANSRDLLASVGYAADERQPLVATDHREPAKQPRVARVKKLEFAQVCCLNIHEN
jgi:hypothetical protein